MTARFLSLVLPARDQGTFIGALLGRHRDALERWSAGRDVRWEIVAVPNACTDDTAAVVRSLAASDERIVCREIPLPGWGRAVRAGLAVCRGDALCYANSARTEPETVTALVALFDGSGGRFAKVRRVRRGAWRREAGSALFNLEARVLHGVRSADVNGTPKILSRALHEALALESDGDLLDLELMAKLRRARVPVVEMTVAGFRRHGGRSTTTLASAWRMYAGAWALRRTIRAFDAGRAAAAAAGGAS